MNYGLDSLCWTHEHSSEDSPKRSKAIITMGYQCAAICFKGFESKPLSVHYYQSATACRLIHTVALHIAMSSTILIEKNWVYRFKPDPLFFIPCPDNGLSIIFQKLNWTNAQFGLKNVVVSVFLKLFSELFLAKIIQLSDFFTQYTWTQMSAISKHKYKLFWGSINSEIDVWPHKCK